MYFVNLHRIFLAEELNQLNVFNFRFFLNLKEGKTNKR